MVGEGIADGGPPLSHVGHLPVLASPGHSLSRLSLGRLSLGSTNVIRAMNLQFLYCYLVGRTKGVYFSLYGQNGDFTRGIVGEHCASTLWILCELIVKL